ncbi:putative dihydroxyacetone kinase subunit 1 [Actinoplanes missouriensis 431]|uniref:Putative dihydroxyacetone kinase subunit 1 n=1 Tax=Actinoplanes missouriensis (strain ATCC 14538 / DSM 43046 / CBS 188.64 / JCM 3121 / NBRC 102363 / NCIMB 12654 / NRRL B-3342 / UNCC 431) TaxID=512565 RepID=I0HCV7_ACTM4|nr:dihydroxyacetone kinase subunit DhaK [Actinoplanes missouriensis]BAL90844.1 putative dihydroxyacetone kinase subunit 1 [Actinoplanes missouriensis 431]
MKKFINDPADVVAEALAGLAAAHPELRVDAAEQYVARAGTPRAGKVALVSGGGSGHEPLHGGFVGPGMLDAACPGEIFTSPVPDQILAATKAVDGGAGVVHVVKNYTGDVMNFQLAAEMAADEGITVETVLVDDDVAVENSTWTAGRRGTGATLLVEKIAGARAEEGGKLAEVAAIGRRVNERSASFAYALTAGTTPSAGRPGFDLPEDEIEVGVGIHGEPGRRREKLRPARELVASALDAIVTAKEPGDRVIVLVNGLGGTPLIELYLVYGELTKLLEARNITIERRLIGNYVTSLDMAGLSITLTGVDDEMLRLWDAPVVTPGLRWGA